MKVLEVDLGARSYPIYIGEALLADASLYAKHIVGRQVMVVTNDTVAPIYLDTLLSALSDYSVDSVVLPDGEQYKTLDTLNLIFSALLEKKHNRKTTLIALGGGVIGDMTGFAAACYQRGVNFIQVPTTLLSQVDSSVGGKTGVNHVLGKNMIGAFYQPKAVIIDVNTLLTLPPRELSAGLAEVIKYGLIRDDAFYKWLESHADQLLSLDVDAISYAIETSCLCKASVVAEDETEKDVRAILNLGHTFGHAIETHMGYGNWLHGEAVAAGMVMALDLSCRLGWVAESEIDRLKLLLKQVSLPIAGPASMTADDYLPHMLVDKKNVDGSIRLVLLERVGFAVVTSNYPSKALSQTLQACSSNKR
ncbi:MAG: 3-dehydroquinate synthase [Hahellaceae bacterium]|nr:3-dehydroquinate synthase [Hahellaceae bacterium]MCP5210599.1 3-dehydroquinate synthase [Hahellaceae bacterium]